MFVKVSLELYKATAQAHLAIIDVKVLALVNINKPRESQVLGEFNDDPDSIYTDILVAINEQQYLELTMEQAATQLVLHDFEKRMPDWDFTSVAGITPSSADVFRDGLDKGEPIIPVEDPIEHLKRLHIGLASTALENMGNAEYLTFYQDIVAHGEKRGVSKKQIDEEWIKHAPLPIEPEEDPVDHIIRLEKEIEDARPPRLTAEDAEDVSDNYQAHLEYNWHCDEQNEYLDKAKAALTPDQMKEYLRRAK